MKWTCTGCAKYRAASDRVACPLCCGWTSVTKANARARAKKYARVMQGQVAA